MTDLRSWWASASPREKDALVAKAMEWDHSHQVDECEEDRWYTRCVRCGAEYRCGDGKLKSIGGDSFDGHVYVKDCTVPPPYTSPNSAAFLQVVEKMLNIRTPEGYHKYQVKIDSDGPHRWSVAFKDDPLHEPLAICSTLPDAICLAALLALEVES